MNLRVRLIHRAEVPLYEEYMSKLHYPRYSLRDSAFALVILSETARLQPRYSPRYSLRDGAFTWNLEGWF